MTQTNKVFPRRERTHSTQWSQCDGGEGSDDCQLKLSGVTGEMSLWAPMKVGSLAHCGAAAPSWGPRTVSAEGELSTSCPPQPCLLTENAEPTTSSMRGYMLPV